MHTIPSLTLSRSAPGAQPLTIKNFLALLPARYAPVVAAIYGAEVLDKGGDTSLFMDFRVLDGLMLAHSVHRFETRKFGGKPSASHEAMAAYYVFQVAIRPDVELALEQIGIRPIDLAICETVHDVPEALHARAKAEGRPSDGVNQIAGEMISAAIGKKTYSLVNRNGWLVYMSDLDSTLPKPARLAAQRAKGYENGKFTLPIAHQILRIEDKAAQVMSDAQACRAEAAELRLLGGTEKQWDDLRAKATRAANSAKMRMYVLEFPMARYAEIRLFKALGIIERTARGNRFPDLDARASFGVVAAIASARVTGAARRIWTSSAQLSSGVVAFPNRALASLGLF